MVNIKKIKFLVVQGRTLPQEEEFIQYFPSKWEDEFPLIAELKLHAIEWIYDKKSESNNPILDSKGRMKIKQLSKKYNVELENIVFDWYIEHPLFNNDIYSENQKLNRLKFLIECSAKTGFKRIIFPLLENNNIDSEERKTKFFKIANKIKKLLQKYDIEMHLETSLNPNDERNILKKLDCKWFKICFDMGNSASFGFEPEFELSKIKEFLGTIHIKDRILGGESVPLGKGNVDFKTVFDIIKKSKINVPYSFQVYRNKSSDNLKVLQESVNFIKKFLVKTV